MDTVKLNNGVEMPQMGYGVYQVSPAECEKCVSDALSVGYRMIDTAQAYNNEEGVGNAVRKSGIDRHDVFLVSKVWISNYGYAEVSTRTFILKISLSIKTYNLRHAAQSFPDGIAVIKKYYTIPERKSKAVSAKKAVKTGAITVFAD